jgi:lysophospholipase L1-like esterase
MKLQGGMTRITRRCVLALLVAWSSAQFVFTACVVAEDYGQAPAFADGDRVCCIGDSITAGGLYQLYLDLFYATRHPDRSIAFYNCGIGGDTAAAIVEGSSFRIQRDVLDHRPTVATVMLGINDIQSRLYDSKEQVADAAAQRQEALDRYRSSMPQVLTSLRDAGVRVILFTPSVFDDTAVKKDGTTFVGANDALKKCSTCVRQWARDFGMGLVEIHDTMDRINLAEQAENPAFTIHGIGQKSWNDRVHPGPGAHLVIAFAVLKAQQMNGAVAKVVVHAPSGRVLQQENARVSNVQAGDGSVEFDVLAKAIPVVLPKEARAALPLVPFHKEFNQELLAVPGLRAGAYQLVIDGKPVGVYTAEEFTAGIDLAENPKTPQYQQSAQVTGLCMVRFDLGARQRHLATFRYARAKQGKDPFDDAALSEQFLTGLGHQVDHPPTARRAELIFPTCIEDLAGQGIMARLHEKLGEQLRSLCRPVAHHYTVAAVVGPKK